MVRIDTSAEFARQLKHLAKKYRSMKSDYAEFLDFIASNPHAGVDLGDGLHKVRLAIASKGKGKSGGARIITYIIEETGEDIIINLLTIYDKSEIESISDSYIKALVAELKEQQ